MLQAPSLSRLARIRHAFFTRSGGVSDGVYASLNGGVGSNDAPDKVAENRARMAATLGVAPDRFLTPYQIHSPDVAIADGSWTQVATLIAGGALIPAGSNFKNTAETRIIEKKCDKK